MAVFYPTEPSAPYLFFECLDELLLGELAGEAFFEIAHHAPAPRPA